MVQRLPSLLCELVGQLSNCLATKHFCGEHVDISWLINDCGKVRKIDLPISIEKDKSKQGIWIKTNSGIVKFYPKIK